jgi:pimeloyl-ACP methyl ester carboxylesterase
MMLSQCWVIHDNMALAAVSRQPVASQYNRAVVLIAGFSQPMCDSGYFMSKLARRLSGEGIYTLQVDPRGHGDSSGNLEDVTLDILRADIKYAVDFAGEQTGGQVFCVGRGLTATLMAEMSIGQPLSGIAGINPYGLEPATVKEIFKEIGSGVVDTADILTGNDYGHFLDFDQDFHGFFEALGSGMLHNLVGQKIATKIIRELMEYEPYPILTASPETKFWLAADQDAERGMRRWTSDEEGERYFRTPREYRENPFSHDPLWHHHAIEMLCNWIIGQGGKANANTGSNRG